MLLHVSLETRKSCPPLSPVTETLEDVAKAHAALDRPDGAGRFVGQGR
jgi:carnitine 3-dehydrogenase